MLRNWLIRKLGGVSSRTFNDTSSEFVSRLSVNDGEINWLRSELEKERARKDALQSIIFEKFGIVTPHQESEMRTEPLKPLQVTNENWARRKNRLERDDAKRAADARAIYWESKNAKVGEGI